MMKNNMNYLYDAEIIRRAEQERSKVIIEFFTGLFSRDKHDHASSNAVAAK
ncbi:MAG: hypothetical protein O7A62_01475 [Alphaproteobacteria bacterium]|nr:hypothetical protein [Alphaproteobacteria bacterium]